MSASDIFSELRGIQELLAGGASVTLSAAPAPPSAMPCGEVTDTDSEGDEALLQAVRKPIAPAGPHQEQTQRDLGRQVVGLRQKQAETEDKCRQLETALLQARKDGELVAIRLRGELTSKQEECVQLAEMVFSLREELEALRGQLQRSTQQAEEEGRATQTSVAKLQEVAAEWRRQGEERLEALCSERARSAALQEEAHRVQERASQLQAELGEERRHREAATAELKALQAEVGGPGGSWVSLVAELRQRLDKERRWRKSVGQWLRGEMQAKKELERVLLNVSSAARCGPTQTADHGARCARQTAVPTLPPRSMAASQLLGAQDSAAVQVDAAQDGSSLKVTVHSPRAAMVSVSSAFASNSNSSGNGKSNRSAGAATTSSNPGNGVAAGPNWRQHFQATMRAFDERHQKLQQELSALRREAFQLAD